MSIAAIMIEGKVSLALNLAYTYFLILLRFC